MDDYDRELIACMLERCEHTDYTRDALVEQARLLREADNADAAGVHTATQPPAVGVDEAMVERAARAAQEESSKLSGVDSRTAWRCIANAALTAALRTGGAE